MFGHGYYVVFDLNSNKWRKKYSELDLNTNGPMLPAKDARELTKELNSISAVPNGEEARHILRKYYGDYIT